jgi:hypothetical protein
MALDFPNTPTNGQIYSSGSSAWLFDGTKWNPSGTGFLAFIGDTPPTPPPTPGLLWWNSSPGIGQLYVYYNDGTSSQWVAANNMGGGLFLPLTGGTLTGPLVLSGNATAPLNPVTLQQLQAGWLPLTGGTLSGPGNLTVNGYLGIGTTPPSDAIAGTVMASVLTTSGSSAIFNNVYNASGGAKLLTAAAALALNMSGGNFAFYHAPSAAAGSTPAWTQVFWIDGSGNAYLGGTNLWFAGVSSGNGPKAYGDITNMSWQLGTGNGTYYWFNNPGAQAMALNAAGTLIVPGELISTLGNNNYGGLRLIGGNYGVMFRNDGTNLYLLLTASGSQYGGWNGLRPIQVGLSDGSVVIGNGLWVNAGNLTIQGCDVYIQNNHWIYCRDASNNAAPVFGMYTDNYLYVGDSSHTMMLRGNYVFFQTHTVPYSNNGYICGGSGNSWSNVWSYVYTTASDGREKRDFHDLPDCLNLVKTIKPQRFRWKYGPTDYERERVNWGFVAQDVGAAMTDAGHEFSGHRIERGHRTQRDSHALEYNQLTAVLWKAVQELSAELETLKARLA